MGFFKNLFKKASQKSKAAPNYHVAPPSEKVNFQLEGEFGIRINLLNIFSKSIPKLEEVLSSEDTRDHQIGTLATILFESDGRIKEVEDYLDRYRVKFVENIERFRKEKNISEIDENIKIDSTKNLGLRPFSNKRVEVHLISALDRTDLIFLFEGPYPKIEDSKKIVELLGGEEQFQYNLKFYTSRGANSVHCSTEDDYYRKRFVSLWQSGLVGRGKEIPAVDALHVLKLKELKELLSDFSQKIRSLKDGLELAKSLPDIQDRFYKYFSKIDDLFQLKPLPVNTNTEEIFKSWNYHFKIADMALRIIK